MLKLDLVVERLYKMKLGKVSKHVAEDAAETLAYMDYSSTQWKKIRTNNSLERVIREIRKRTRVIGAFPDGNSALMLVAARLRHITGTKWGAMRYLKMDKYFEQEKEKRLSRESSNAG